MSQLFNDFQKQNVKFDIIKLKQACDEVLKIKGFDTSLGIPHFAGIPLNQIPGDPDSVKGNNVRGIYWTKPDSTGVLRYRGKVKLMNKNIQNLLTTLKILISKKFMIN